MTTPDQTAYDDRARALYAWQDRIDLLREVDRLRADQAAAVEQARAEGAAGERERIALAIEAKADALNIDDELDNELIHTLDEAAAIARTKPEVAP